MVELEFKILCLAVLCGICAKGLTDLIGISNLIGIGVGWYVWVELIRMVM